MMAAIARNGHAAMSDMSPLPGVKRKSDFGAVRAAFDPSETFGLTSCCCAKWRGAAPILRLTWGGTSKV
jgi:hypothetical protein